MTVFLVYFSSTTRNTERFVAKLGLRSARIPLLRDEEPLRVDEPFVLVCPTYGGGASISGDLSRPVPKQVIRFLNDEHNRSLIRGVIASGNLNFGEDFGRAGDGISAKCRVPYLYRFELMGNEEDVVRVREGLAEFEDAQRASGRWDPPPEQVR